MYKSDCAVLYTTAPFAVPTGVWFASTRQHNNERWFCVYVRWDRRFLPSTFLFVGFCLRFERTGSPPRHGVCVRGCCSCWILVRYGRLCVQHTVDDDGRSVDACLFCWGIYVYGATTIYTTCVRSHCLCAWWVKSAFELASPPSSTSTQSHFPLPTRYTYLPTCSVRSNECAVLNVTSYQPKPKSTYKASEWMCVCVRVYGVVVCAHT